ncbi:hypothetical protein MMC19_002779 [Ptychographa xylographoides]|nr:hypothetical protein [Ptychographa xylographoides]
MKIKRSLHMGAHAPRIIRSVLEVERKFAPPVDFLSRLIANRGPPAFECIQYTGQSSFEDIYYDHNNTLYSHGIWVRNRSGAWQAKIRRGGDFINSQFTELSNIDDIRHLVESHSGHTGSKEYTFGLTEFARFVTQRRSWKVEGGFEIVYDETDFGHTVGEVELQKANTGDKENAERESEQAREMDEDIKRFMERYNWAFPPGKPVGKLTAYCTMKMG